MILRRATAFRLKPDATRDALDQRTVVRIGEPLRLALDVFQHAAVDRMQDGVGDRGPVRRRLHVEGVPGPSFEPRACPLQRDQPELAVRCPEETVQVRREHAGIRTPLVQRRRLRDDVEGQPARRIPHRNGLDKRAGRELAVADRADAAALQARPQRIGEARAEVPGRRRRDFAERSDVLPHHRRRRIDLDRGHHDTAVRRGHGRFDDAAQRDQREEEREMRERRGPAALGEQMSDERSERRDRRRNRHRHHQA